MGWAMRMAAIRWVGWGIGMAILIGLFLQIDFRQVASLVTGFRWQFVAVLAFYALVFGLDTLGWRYAFRPSLQNQVPWFHLFRARLIGEAVNYVTPTAWIGGEPVKVTWLVRRHRIPLGAGITSVVVAKTTFALSMLLFVFLGTAVAILSHPLPTALRYGIKVTLPILIALIGCFLLVQFVKPFGRMMGGLTHLGPAKWMESWHHRVKAWEEAVVKFYRHFPSSVLVSFLFHFLGWVAGACEVFLILWWLGWRVPFLTAVAIEALWVLFKSTAFFIPASLGASEGIGVMVCMGFGVGAVHGLALGLIRRLRELVWVGLGLADLGFGGTIR